MVDDAAFCHPGKGAWERGEPAAAAVHGPTDEVAGEIGRLRLDRGKAQAQIREGGRRGRGGANVSTGTVAAARPVQAAAACREP
jgi:hypothetical protein